MSLEKLITPLARVATLVTTDSVRDALGELASHHAAAAPLVDGDGRYAGTLTAADLQRHVASGHRRAAMRTPLRDVAQRAHNPALAVDESLAVLAARACGHGFVPVVDGDGKLLGIIERRRLPDLHFPSAA
jgi:CBS domain-containing protein